MTGKLSYRLFEERDLPGVLKLWEDHSGWGGISEEQFRRWYLNTPYGQCIVVVAINEYNEIVGQTVFTPSRMHLDGSEVNAIRISAPILCNQVRQTDIRKYEHPAFSMIRYGMDEAKHRGYGVAYVFPAIGWTSLMKMFPRFGLAEIAMCSFDCFSISLENPETYAETSSKVFVAVRGSDFEEEYESLWEKAVDYFPFHCAIVRNRKWLKWKLGPHLIFEARDIATGLLTGYVALKKDSGLLMDMLARTPADLKECFAAVIHAIHTANPERIPVAWKEIKGMYTPKAKALLESIPFNFKDFKSAFGCYPLQNFIQQHQIEPVRWYMMPND